MELSFKHSGDFENQRELVEHDLIRPKPIVSKTTKKVRPATNSLEDFNKVSRFQKFVNAWGGQEMAMDLGTANTLIYIKGEGIVLDEPSVVTVHKDTGKVMAVGTAAKEMYGKTAEAFSCIRPLKDGVIADFETTHLMIKDFITRVSKRWQLRKPRLVISIPSGITMVEKRAVMDAALSAGAREIHLVEEPMAAAIGSDLDVKSASGNLIVDIGGGTTEVAVISMGATSYSESVRVAGDEMDEAIQNHIRRKFGLQIGIFEAEKIKIAIGSAVPLEHPEELVVYGRDITMSSPREIVIDDTVVREALKEPLEAIVHAVKRALERTSPELAEDIFRRGICLAGGGSLLTGLAERLTYETGIKFHCTPDPLTAIVRGAGKIVDSFKSMQTVCIA